MDSTRSPTTLRAISTVPPPMLPPWRIRKLRALWAAALSSVQAAPAAPATSRASVTILVCACALPSRTSAAAWSDSWPRVMRSATRVDISWLTSSSIRASPTMSRTDGSSMRPASSAMAYTVPEYMRLGFDPTGCVTYGDV